MADDADSPREEPPEATPESPVPTDSTEAEPTDSTEAEPTDSTEAEPTDSTEAVGAAPSRRPMSPLRLGTIVGLAVVVVLAGLTGWLGYRAYQVHQTEQRRELFLAAARQGAVDLTSIDWQHAEADVQRVLDSATGTFYDDFQQRAEPFTEVVKQAKSKSVGTVTEAGVESVSGNSAEVLVAVTVNTTNAGAPEQAPRAWRMRLTVRKEGGKAKVSNVEFVQ